MIYILWISFKLSKYGIESMNISTNWLIRHDKTLPTTWKGLIESAIGIILVPKLIGFRFRVHGSKFTTDGYCLPYRSKFGIPGIPIG